MLPFENRRFCAQNPHLLCDLVWNWYCLTQFFFFLNQRSSYALLTTASSEMHQWQSSLYHALASAQIFAIII